MERCQEHRPGCTRFRGILEREVFVSTPKVQKMRQIMTARNGKCSKQGDYMRLGVGSIQGEKVFQNGNSNHTLRDIRQCSGEKCLKTPEKCRM